MDDMSENENLKPLNEMTRDELRKVAAELKIAGRGTMLKPALVEAIAHERAARIKENVNRPRSGQGVPMTDGKRRLNYFRQNGHTLEFTPKQRRRYAKKAMRNKLITEAQVAAYATAGVR
jgi:hypothetical protein